MKTIRKTIMITPELEKALKEFCKKQSPYPKSQSQIICEAISQYLKREGQK